MNPAAALLTVAALIFAVDGGLLAADALTGRGGPVPAVERPAPDVPEPTTPQQARLYEIADSFPVDWRGHGVELHVGCHPDKTDLECGYGSFHKLDYRVHVRPDVFDDDEMLAYTVAHEMAHVWQRNHVYGTRTMDLGQWGIWGREGIEKAADCLAKAWGHPGTQVYWDCPDDAATYVLERFESTTAHHRD